MTTCPTRILSDLGALNAANRFVPLRFAKLGLRGSLGRGEDPQRCRLLCAPQAKTNDDVDLAVFRFTLGVAPQLRPLPMISLLLERLTKVIYVF